MMRSPRLIFAPICFIYDVFTALLLYNSSVIANKQSMQKKTWCLPKKLNITIRHSHYFNIICWHWILSTTWICLRYWHVTKHCSCDDWNLILYMYAVNFLGIQANCHTSHERFTYHKLQFLGYDIQIVIYLYVCVVVLSDIFICLNIVSTIN